MKTNNISQYKPFEIYRKLYNGCCHYRVIICSDDTIKDGIRFYEGYWFKRWKDYFIIKQATYTPNVKRYSMKNWEKVDMTDITGKDFYVCTVMLNCATYRVQPYLNNGKAYIVSERRKLLDAMWVGRSCRKGKTPDYGFSKHPNFLLAKHIPKDIYDKYVPEDFSF